MKHMWKAAWGLICLMVLFACACACAEEAADWTARICPEVVRSQLKLNSKTGFTRINTKTRFTNESDVGIMEVHYTVTVYDANGQALSQHSSRFNGLDTPIAPGQSAEHETGWQYRLAAQAHHVDVTVTKVCTEDELPPVRLPKPGEALYQALGNAALSSLAETLPTEIQLYIDRGGSATISVVNDEQTIRETVRLFMNIQVAKETQEWVTDNYNSVSFTFADGSAITLSLNLWNLELYPYGELKLYELENLTPFVSYMQHFVTSED